LKVTRCFECVSSDFIDLVKSIACTTVSFHAVRDRISSPSSATSIKLVDQAEDVNDLNRVEALAVGLLADAHFLGS